jgi:hypothetical protein
MLAGRLRALRRPNAHDPVHLYSPPVAVVRNENEPWTKKRLRLI